jgi:hypothetical protein
MAQGPIPDLDPRPARALTSREIAKVLGGTIGGLLGFCAEEDVRSAVRWLSDSDAFWTLSRVTVPRVEAAAAEVLSEHLSDENEPS